MAGFVTSIDSFAEFSLGHVEVKLDPETRCELQTVEHSFQFRPHTGKVYLRAHFSENKESNRSSSACNIDSITIGSYVRVTGQLHDGNQLFATRIIVNEETLARKEVEGGGLLEEPDALKQQTSNSNENIWINGYPIKITPQTELLTAPANTDFRYRLYWRSPMQIQAKFHSPEIKGPPSVKIPTANDWIIYHGKRDADGTTTAYKVRIWPNSASLYDVDYPQHFIAHLNYADYREQIPDALQYRGAEPIQIIQDQFIQKWVTKIGNDIIPSYQRSLPKSDATKVNFRFYVVRPFGIMPGFKFVDTDGDVSVYRFSSHNVYPIPLLVGVINHVVAMPDGVILVPTTVLANLNTDAQLAALLSFSTASILQAQTRHVNSVNPDSLFFYRFLVSLTEQKLRVGIRQLYLAGYDIREAPFAWAVAQGKPVNNPVIDSRHPDKKIPWYAAYAFNYISQYYKDVDYSKLKRGEAEYREFLKELYKADPTLQQRTARASRQ
jgi:hypothetical protein